jgi:neutral peptidase B
MALCMVGAAVLLVRSRPRPTVPPPAAPHGEASGKSFEGNKQPIRDSTNAALWLVAFDGSESIPLDEDTLSSPEGMVIGRAAELVHVCMESLQVSRRHLRIRRHGPDLFCEDLNSSHGTEVDGQRTVPFTPVVLSPGGFVRIAGFSYQLVRRS